jgi:hypothetical protein
MKRILHVLLFISFLAHASCQKDDLDAKFTITLFGKVTNSETGQPVKDVVISDGYTTTITNKSGTYSFKGHTNARHIFYSVPEVYEIPLKDGVPGFYEKINTTLDSIETNFKLTLLKTGIENKFTLFCVADPQVLETKSITRLKNETIIDLKKEKQLHNLVYGITLGDLVDDKPELMEDLKHTFVSTQIPFFHTIGNHDYIEGFTDPVQSIENYENHFGPTDYSFNRGKVHIVVMNNVLYKGNRSYGRGFTSDQIEWLKSNLQYVPENKMLIVCLHIPIIDDNRVQNRKEFLDAIKRFKEVHIMTGHYHLQKKFWHNDYSIYEHITGAASGIWWSGTINKCGAPNGFAVYEIDGNTMSNWYYKPVNYPSSFQIKMYAPYSFGDTEGFVVANVWNADKDWTVELLENGTSMGKMEQYTNYDPGTYAFLKASGKIEPGNENASNKYTETDHLFRLKPRDKNAEITIKATDRFGNIYYQNKFFESINEFKKYE